MLNLLQAPLIRKIANLLIHPLTLSVIVTIFLLQIFPLHIPKYQIKIQQSYRNTEQGIVVWEDLENDGTSDWIPISQVPIGYAVVAAYFYPSGRPKEWDIPGKLVNVYNNDFFIIGSPYENKNKEIFVFTQSNDSLFLNRISDLSDQKPVYTQKFISTFKSVIGASDVRIIAPRLMDLDGDRTKELIFGITSGFSIIPRALFIYNFKIDTLLRSIETGNSLYGFLTLDMNGDHRKEIITKGYAPRNLTDTVVKFHDSSNWAMVFDDKLNLLFPPAEFKGRTGVITPLSLITPSSQSLFILWDTPTNNNHGVQLFRITRTGEKQFVKEFTEFDKKLSTVERFFTKINEEYKLVIPLASGDIFFFDTLFKKYDVVSLNQPITYLQRMDVDLDGQPEILVFDIVSRRMTIYREDFSHPSSINVECADPSETTISLKNGNNKPSLISLCAGNLHYTLSYQENPYWNTRWGIWAAISLSVFLFTLLIRKIQRSQLEKRFATEKKITELQLKIVRNQMDPHFTMNAINAVVDAINREEKEQARDNLLHFSKMYRSLVLSADKIKRSLREEIDFTENYLALEKFRFGNRFTYNIRIDPDVDLGWEVPKMVIQSPVENAVKHGLRTKDVGCGAWDVGRGTEGEGGFILIRVRNEERALVLDITDNGVGREAAAKEGKTSTGKGMEIMEQFFDLYHKITGIRVQSNIMDLRDETGKAAGTKVVVIIPLS
jgi:hypothetical protein